MKKVLQYVALPLLLGLLAGCNDSADNASAGSDLDGSGETKAQALAESSAPEPRSLSTSGAADKNTFTNPIYPNGADPWLEYFEGNYYLTTTTWTSQLVMRKSPTLAGLATATPINIWSESAAERCCNFWAFEFHRLNTNQGPRWYVIYTSGIADNYDHQHLSVIESQGDDPMGPYTYKGSPMPDSWNIDGTYYQTDKGLYLLWSEWVGDEQSLFIAKMSNPWTLSGDKVRIGRPEFDWEKSGMKVNEGPEVLQRNGKTFIVYSASFCNTPDYKLGVLELTGSDPLKPEAWHKFDKPFFSRANGVYGPGHNGFFKSPDGSEDWLIYHGNADAREGCSSTRSLRAQKFAWTDDGLPNFGEPVAAGVPVISPAGENGPLVTPVQGTQVRLMNKANGQCALATAAGLINGDCAAENSVWNLDYTSAGQYRLVTPQGKFLGQCDGGEQLGPWFNRPCQEWKLSANQDAWVSLVNAHTQHELTLPNCSEPAPEQKANDVEDIPNLVPPKASCVQWQLQPVGTTAISSVQSGKMLSAAVIKAGGNIEQREWQQPANQLWQFVPVDGGFFAIKPAGAIKPEAQDELCITLANKSIVPGTNVELGDCSSPHAHWAADFLADGTARLRNRRSGLMLDLANCGLADGTNLAEAQWLDSSCQKFQLKPIR